MEDPKHNSKAPTPDKPKSESAKREEATLAWWKQNDIFKKTLEKHAPKGDFVFYDGPPFATGTPHYGHLLQSAVKDAIPRYRTMCGYRVVRQWGWDCHGLPIENIVEKELGTKSKKDILQMGVKKFNDLCRERIFTFIGEWERIMPRFGRWADMEHPYRTMDLHYMESEWWAFKALFEKGLIYEDYRSMHICPRCETTLSQSEVAEGYKDVKDLSVIAKFKLKNPEKIGLSGDVYILAWTTTPWTLPGNVALAVGEGVRYTIAKRSPVQNFKDGEEPPKVINERYIFATARLRDVMKETAFDGETEVEGRELVGLEYVPLFDSYAHDNQLKNHGNGWKVYAGDFVTTEDGTGIVHIAPAFGADDMTLAKKENLPFVQHVGMDGVVRPEVKELAGLHVKPAHDVQATDVEVIKCLAHKGLLFSKEKYEHSYPHCWRCDTPLINYATSSWFVAVEKIKPTLLETAKAISWSPKHIKEGRWGDWLKGARDWSISRQRFWANTIPVWRCEKCKSDKVVGSASELHELSGVEVKDLHKEFVDEIAFTCWNCDGAMRRVPDVLDTWFDSGSVPFAIEHYPFEHEARFKARTPADFIGEAQDQTRAWFYYQHVLAGALFGTHAFKNVIVTGLVLAEDGKKMSKKLKNYPDPAHIIDKYGADALRYYLLSSAVVQADNLNFSERGVEEIVKKNLGRLGNVLEFWKLYDDGTPRDWKSAHVLDRWILVRLDELVREVTAGFEGYRPDVATRPLVGFIDDLSVWYLRRSRDRYKPARTTEDVQSGGEENPDRQHALATLRYVLHRLALVMAPSMPFFAEHLFQAVREGEDEESVHLAVWPEATATRNFFQRLFSGDPDKKLIDSMQAARDIVSQALEAREKAGIKVRQPLQSLRVDSRNLTEEFLQLVREEVNVKAVISGKDLSLDTNITPELKEEGVVRELIRSIQQYRKEQCLKPGEETSYTVTFSDENRAIIEKYREKIESQTSTKLSF